MPKSNVGLSRQTTCGIPGPREERLQDSGLDTFEINALEVMRLIFARMSGNTPRYTPEVEAVAETLFGRPHSALVVAGLTAFVQVMAMSRTQRFHYSNPFCAGCATIMTQNEGHLMRVLHHVRRGQSGRAMTHALLLCEARPVAGLLEAAHDIAALAPMAGDAGF